jgi:NTE family protein
MPIPTPFRTARTPTRPLTAFVLSGGASLGALQAGMLRALYERGIFPDMIVATSAGALNGGFIASRPRTLATIDDLDEVWRSLRREHIFPISVRTVIAGLASHRDHLVPDRGVRDLVRRHLQVDDLAEMEVPLHLIAFDLLTGDEVRLSTGPALEAILASSAIPSVLPPVWIRGALLVDGGVVDNTPISHAAALGAERVFVLSTDDPSLRGLPQPPHGALDAAVHAFRLLANARLIADLERYRSELDLIVLPAPNPGQVQPTDFAHAQELLDAAYRAVSQMLHDKRTLGNRGDHHDSSFDDDRADVRWLGRLSERWSPARALPRHRRAVAGAAVPERHDEPLELTAPPAGGASRLSRPSHRSG